MNYPTGNLKKDYVDINSDNYLVIAEYNNLIKEAFETKNFDKVNTFIKSNTDVLAANVRTAESMNALVDFIEQLKNYTIAVKNQVHFIDKYISDEDFNSLDANLVENDVVIYTYQNGLKTSISTIKIKQADNSYTIIYDTINPPATTYYVTLTSDDIINFSESTETFNYTVYNYHRMNNLIVSTTLITFPDENNYPNLTYAVLNNVDVEKLNDGDTISIRYCSDNPINLSFIKINDMFYALNTGKTGFDSSVTLVTNKVYNLVYDSNLLSLSPQVGNAGYTFYDSESGTATVLPNGFTCDIATSADEISYINERYSSYTSLKHALDSILVSTTTKESYGNVKTIWDTVDFEPFAPNSASLTIEDFSKYITTPNPLSYMRKNNNLYLRGNISIDLSSITQSNKISTAIGTAISNSDNVYTWLTLCQLPYGYFPSTNTYWTCMGSGGYCYNVAICSDGYVRLGRCQHKITYKQKMGWMPINIVCPLD